MKAAVLNAFGTPLVVETLPDPVPVAGELVVDVLAAPVFSYTHEVLSGARQYPLLLPLAVGCGGFGRIRAVGPDATLLKPGDLVFCDPAVRSRDDSVLTQVMLQGWIAPGPGAQTLQAHFRHGAFAELMLLPLENAIPLGAVDPADLGKWCAMGTALVPYGGLLAANLKAGEIVLISGATGHFGSAGVGVALAMGAAAVIAPGRNQTVLADLSRRYEPRVIPVVLTGDEAEDQRRMREAAPGPIDVVLDLLPPLTDALPVRTAALTVRPHGTIVLMGGLRVDLGLPYAHLQRNCITDRGQHMYPRDAPARLIALVKAGLFSLADLTLASFSLEQANEAVAHAAAMSGPFHYTVIEPGVGKPHPD